MKWNLLLPVLLLSGLIACGDKDDDDEDDDDCEDSGECEDEDEDDGSTTGGTTTGGGGGPTVSVTWGGSSVDVDIAGGPGAYWFGLAETSGCDDCWTGEDCIYGYQYSGGSLEYCHDAGDTGTSLTYGGDATNLSAGTTVFPDSSRDGAVTYYLESDPEYGGDGNCFVFGADTSYYDGLGCTNL
jgi:hypothetical protein